MTTGGMLDRTAISLTKPVCRAERTIDCERVHGMPDLIHSTTHSWHSSRLHTLAQTLAHDRIDGGGNTVQFCSPLQKYFRASSITLRQYESPETRRRPRRQSNQLERIIATAASRYKAKRSVLRKNGTDASSKQAA
jgi:hypothetical protein